MKVNVDALDDAMKVGFLTATDLADWLVKELGLPFRQAHQVTGKIVKMAEDKNCELEQLTLIDMQIVEAKITEDVFSVLSPSASVNSRTSFGGTAPGLVKKAIKEARGRFL